jgi:hypothetical protein
VEQVNSFKFLDVHITKELIWSTHTNTVAKKAQQHLFPLRRLKRFGMDPQILKSSKSSTAEQLRASWHLTARHYRESSRTSLPGGVRGRAEKLSKTQAIDCSPSLGPKGSRAASTPKP